MAEKLLSDFEIKNAKPEAKEKLLADGDRLFLRIRPTGEKHWLFIYTFDGKRTKMMIGSYPTVTATLARDEARRHRELLAKGIDPKQQKASDQIARQAKIKADKLALEATSNRMTVNQLFTQWEKLSLKDRKDGGKEVRRMFEKDILPTIGEIAVEDVKKAHIVLILNALLERGVNRMSKLILSLTRQMFRYAQDQDIIENDPTSSIRKSKVGGKDTIRDRVLTDAEIKELKAKMPNARFLISTECALWVMLSTLCRIGEICKAQWSHLDLDAGTWKIPKENSKNGKAHTIYLSGFATEQFKRLVAIKSSKTWIYPNTDDTNHVCQKSISKQVGDRQLSEKRKEQRAKGRMQGRSKNIDALMLSEGKWTPHDLRRTGATIMGNLNVRPDVIEKCLNHVEQNKMRKTYQHQTLIAEQQQAWALLGERLVILTSKDTSNVTSLSNKKTA